MNCDRCGANLALVGKSHRCVANVANTRVPVANIMIVTPQQRADIDHAASPTYGRYRDAEARKAYMRDYMRTRRKKIGKAS
jgi:hypothetical protein